LLRKIIIGRDWIGIKSVERILKTAARLVTKIAGRDSVTDKLNNELRWLGPKQLYYRSILCIMYKLRVNDNAPQLLKDLFKTTSEVHNYFTRSTSNVFQSAMPIREIGTKCFEHIGAKLWNVYGSEMESLSFVHFKWYCNQMMLENVDRF